MGLRVSKHREVSGSSNSDSFFSCCNSGAVATEGHGEEGRKRTPTTPLEAVAFSATLQHNRSHPAVSLDVPVACERAAPAATEAADVTIPSATSFVAALANRTPGTAPRATLAESSLLLRRSNPLHVVANPSSDESRRLVHVFQQPMDAPDGKDGASRGADNSQRDVPDHCRAPAEHNPSMLLLASARQSSLKSGSPDGTGIRVSPSDTQHSSSFDAHTARTSKSSRTLHSSSSAVTHTDDDGSTSAAGLPQYSITDCGSLGLQSMRPLRPVAGGSSSGKSASVLSSEVKDHMAADAHGDLLLESLHADLLHPSGTFSDVTPRSANGDEQVLVEHHTRAPYMRVSHDALQSVHPSGSLHGSFTTGDAAGLASVHSANMIVPEGDESKSSVLAGEVMNTSSHFADPQLAPSIWGSWTTGGGAAGDFKSLTLPAEVFSLKSQ